MPVTLTPDGTLSVVNGGAVVDASLVRLRQPVERWGTTAAGTGLGLAIAERVARAQGGALELHSAPGQGLRARLVLPQTGPGGEPATA